MGVKKCAEEEGNVLRTFKRGRNQCLNMSGIRKRKYEVRKRAGKKKPCVTN